MHPDLLLFKSFLRRMFETLKLLMTLGISHNDLKPENLLLSFHESLSLKLIDFGSCSFREDQTRPSLHVSRLEYMPPERLACLAKPSQALFQVSQPYPLWAADMWSLGILILELVTGCPVWIPIQC